MNVASVSNLPAGAVDLFEREGITELYPPQAEAVEAGVTTGENLVASVPTASGKTFIAQLAMLSAIERGGKALYIVPLRALASEKAEEFQEFESLGITIGVATGNYEDRGEWLAQKDIIVATSEKVDSLIRNDAPWIDDLSCVVSDEVHLIDDPERGPTLEVTLAKLRRLNPAVQSVALSATIDNAEAIAEWLDAALIDTDWRPIELRSGVHYGDALHYDTGDTEKLSVQPNENPTAAIVRDTLQDDGSALVFVNSRRNAETAADRLGETVSSELSVEEQNELSELADEIRNVSDTETSSDLADCVARGTAFHHAGLTSEHRSLIEDAFRDRLIRTVSATPTLAAGVNTPSRRVIIRDWRRYDGSIGGMKPLPVLEVHQMMGRAGRPGRDPYGEAFLLAKNHDELDELFDRYISADPEPVDSKLAAEPALRTHVLSTIASGFVTTRSGLFSFLSETFYASQYADEEHLKSIIQRVLRYLTDNGFLTQSEESLSATSLGHTVSRLYLDPMSAAEIIAGLRSAGSGSISALGLYHLVTRTPDMYELYLRSGDREKYTEIHYQRETELLGPAPSEFDESAFESWLSALKTARMLEDWASELDEDDITERYGIGPGDIRSKVDTTEWLLGAAEELAAELDLSLTTSIRRARRRVEHGVRDELLELVNIRDIGRKRARNLYQAGIETPEDLRTANKATILSALDGREKTTEKILENADRDDPSVADVQPDDANPADYTMSPESSDTTDNNSTSTKSDDQSHLGDFS